MSEYQPDNHIVLPRAQHEAAHADPWVEFFRIAHELAEQARTRRAEKEAKGETPSARTEGVKIDLATNQTDLADGGGQKHDL
jgi:hypothetical protein